MYKFADPRLLCIYCALAFPVILQAGLTFEPNRGQTSPDIRYVARAANGIVFITDRGVILDAAGQSIPAFELLGANSLSVWQPSEATGKTISYFIGRDPSKWAEDVPRYRRLMRQGVYPGIDLALYGNDAQLEYEFQLAPHADPSRIRMKLTDARRVAIAADGTLLVETAAGELRHRKPILSETLPDGTHRSIAGGFCLLGPDEVGFSVTGHDPAVALSIDPVLESSTYFGGHGDDQVIATDGKGTIVGNTTSIDVPGAAFARRAGTSVFIQQGGFTFAFGCSGNVTATSAAFDVNNSMIAIGGYTDCVDLPTNLGYRFQSQPVIQPDYGGGATDGFLFLTFARTGSGLLSNASLTYFGGPGDDRVNAISTGWGYLILAGSTSAGGLPESSFPPVVQTAPSGGLDAFVAISIPDSYSGLFLQATTYLGGSGDDTALGVANSGIYIYVTGETNSTDFPLAKPLFSKRQGESDAFIAEFFIDGNPGVRTLFGGSGADRGVAATVLPNGNVAVAGVTSSTDLPLNNPTQKAYGGGPSDAFVAQFPHDLSALLSGTYIGGSRSDEATAIASSYPNTIFVGGWTASHDFPTVNALQKSYGGGEDDGFLVHFDDDGSIYEATYFGGSGSDRVLGVNGSYATKAPVSEGPTVWLTGTTTSPNLPLQNASQTTLTGSSDGFVAEVSGNLFTVAPFAGGKDLRGTAYITFGNPQVAGNTIFTITSSDPSKVQVALDTSGPGQKSVVAGPHFNGGLWVDCLSNTGGASLTISGPQYKTEKVPVTCSPAAVWLALPFGTQGELQSGIAYPPSWISFLLGPANGAFTFGMLPRPGSTPPVVEISTSNPSVGSISASSLTLTGLVNNVTFTPLAVGSTTLSFTAGDLAVLPSSTLKIIVGGSYGAFASPFAVPSGFQGALFFQTPAQPKTTTVTSRDPSRVLLSLDPSKAGSRSVTLPPSTPNQAQQVWAQAIGTSGSVPLTISVTGEPDINATINITSPVANLNYGTNTGQAINLSLGGTAGVFVSIQGSKQMAVSQLRRNPGSPAITFSLNSSTPGVVQVTPSSASILPGAFPTAQFQIVGASAGSTVLTATNSANIAAGSTFPSAKVNVGLNAIRFSDLDLGKDLTSPMTLKLPARVRADMQLSLAISDPTLALLSLDGSSPGLPQITTFIAGGQGTVQFYVYGLAAAGQAKVAATLAGGESLSANVNLHPSGFYWGQDSLSASLGSFGSIYPTIDLGPIDSASGLPLGSQGLRPGISSTLGITNSNINVVTLSSTQLAVPIGNSSLVITPKTAGQATLTLHQPQGFTAASVRQKLAVSVTGAGITLYPGVLGKNTQAQLNIGAAGNPVLTITSSDPSKVLLSTDTTKLGTPSVKVQGHAVYMQALAGTGTVTIRVSAPNFAPTSVVYTLVPTGLGITLDTTNSAATYQNGKYGTTTLSGAVSVFVNLLISPNQGASTTLLPGLTPLTANITSSNTGVAVITGSPVTIPPKQPYFGQGLASATLLQVAPGETTIKISQPPGFSSVGMDSLILDVVTPVLSVQDFAAAKDSLFGSVASLPPGLKPFNSPLSVTFTSSDPSRVLLSPDPTTPPAASVTASIKPTYAGVGVYVHALKDNGVVSIAAAAPGFADAPFSVHLFPLAFQFVPTPGSVPIQAFIQSGPQQLQVAALPLIPAGVSLVAVQVAIRPGTAPIAVAVSSSDPKTVSVNPGQLLFQAGSDPPLVKYTPIKPGTATLKLSAPSGYQIVPSAGQVTIDVSQAAFSLGYAPATGPQIGGNLEIPISVGIQAGQLKGPVTVTSSDPSRLLVSTDATSIGQGSLTFTPETVSQAIFAQAVASTGSATLTFKSSGFQTTVLPVTLAPVAAVFQTISSQSLLTNSGVVQQGITLAPLDPLSLLPGSPQTPRPGATLSVSVTSSDPKILAITTPTVQFQAQQPGSQGATVGIQPVSAGTAVVTLEPLAGNPSPANGNQATFTVSEPNLSVPAIAIGRDLEAPVLIQLGNSIDTPQVDLIVTVNTYTAPVLLAQKSGDNGQGSISVTIPAGQRVSPPFYVQGLNTGSGLLSYSSGSFQTYYSPVTVTQTAFVIQEAANGQSLTLNTGATTNLTVVPALSPASMAATLPMSLRPGVPPVTIAVASTNSAVASASPTQVSFNPGDQKQVFSVRGVASGNATVKLLGTNYDFSQPQSSIAVVVK